MTVAERVFAWVVVISIVVLGALLFTHSPARAQAVVTICVQTGTGPSCTPVTSTNPLPVTGGGGGSSSSFGAAFPTTGTAAGFTDGTNMVGGRVGAVSNAAAATGFLDALGVGQYLATPPTLTDTRYNALQLDINGNLRVVSTNGGAVTIVDGGDVGLGATTATAATAGSTGSVNAKLRLMTTQLDTMNTNIQAGAAATGAAVPPSAIYMGVNVGGNLTGFAPGTAGAASTQVVSVQGIASMTPLLATATLSAETTKVIGTVRVSAMAAAARNFPGCTVGTSSAQCLAGATAVNFLQVQNVDSTSTDLVACAFGATAVLNGSGSFLLTPGQSASWGPNTGGVPTGALNCIGTSASTPLYVEWN